jgi:hypothetical protein
LDVSCARGSFARCGEEGSELGAGFSRSERASDILEVESRYRIAVGVSISMNLVASSAWVDLGFRRPRDAEPWTRRMGEEQNLVFIGKRDDLRKVLAGELDAGVEKLPQPYDNTTSPLHHNDPFSAFHQAIQSKGPVLFASRARVDKSSRECRWPVF